ncbi:MAG: M48 family metallopeptidase [Bacteroidota bacterium]
MKHSKYIILSFLMLFTVACSTIPITGRKQFAPIPSSQMIALSKDSYQKVIDEHSLSDNQEQTRIVKEVGRNISSAVEKYLRQQNMKEKINEYTWEYNLLQSKEINAFCMPGGKIAFYEGIMPICEDRNGVAVVMAHEVAHAIAKHANERLAQQLMVQLGGIALSEALNKEPEKTQQLALAAFGAGAQLGYMLPYSRKHESEADELGLYFMAMAGYDPRGAVEFWQRMEHQGGEKPPVFLSTHPPPGKRIKNIEKLMPKALEYYNE